MIDSSSIPVPIDALLIGYVAADHKRFLLYCFMAALGSAVGAWCRTTWGARVGSCFC